MSKGYIFAYESIRRQIELKIFSPCMRLYSENEWCKILSLSRMTVRKALQRLEREKWIYCRVGLGWFVCETIPSHEISCTKYRIGIMGSELLGKTQSYYSTVLNSIQTACKINGAEMVFVDEKDFWQGKNMDAAFALNVTAKEIPLATTLAEKIPVVLLNRLITAPQLSYVAVDYERETSRVIRRLLANGAKNILFVGGAPMYAKSWYAPFIREAGYRSAHLESNIPVNEDLIVPIKFSASNIEDLLLKYQSDVIFVSSEMFLSQVCIAIESIQVKLKKKFYVICFDHIADILSFGRTSVSCGKMPLEDICLRGVEYIKIKLNNKETPAIHEVFPMTWQFTDCPYII